MAEQQYNFVDFIEKVKEMDYRDILTYGDREVADMESKLFSNLGAEIVINTENKKYSDQIKTFLFFMRQGMKPMGVSAFDFKLYRIIVEYLVAKGQMKPEAIEIFISSK